MHMDIAYLGHSSFFIKTKSATILTDPFAEKMVGIPFPSKKADIVTVSHSHEDHSDVQSVKGDPFVIDWPGEFEKLGVRITGFSTFHDDEKGAKRGPNTMYKIEAEQISILHCGDLGHILEEELVEEIGDVDIIMIPTGGLYTIDAKQASKVVKEVDPAIIIPMHYNHDSLDQKTFGELEPVKTFIEELGNGAETVDTISVKQSDIDHEETRLIVFNL